MLRVKKIPLFILGSVIALIVSSAAGRPAGDLNWDCKVDWTDVQIFADFWLDPNCSTQDCMADWDGVPGINTPDFALMANNWLTECEQTMHVTWLGHASLRIWNAQEVIYIDPRKLGDYSPHDATLVLVTHSHGDHYSSTDIAKVSGAGTQLIASADVINSEGWGQAIAPGQTIELGTLSVTGVAAYNINTTYHLKSKNWVGFIIEIGSRRIYNAGDTDMTDEMKALTDIDLALLPVGGKYTMNAAEAAEATGYIQPELAIPCHWGDIIGSLSDAEAFAATAHCDVKIMDVDETISF